MTISREDLNPCTVQLTVTCDPDEVKAGFDKAYRELSKRVKLPGFRPGQAPRSMVQGLLNKNDVYEAAADQIVRHAYKDAIEKEELKPHSMPSVELKSLDEDKSECEFIVKVPLEPQIELIDYKGLAAQNPVLDVSEAEVDRQVDELRKKRSTQEKITDRGAQESDVCVVNLKIEGEQGDGRNFMLVAGQTFPDLDKALLGMKVEEVKKADLAFPDTFQEKDWAGKSHQVRITVRSLSAVKMPELDAQFAQQYKTESVEELRDMIREGVMNAKRAMADDYVTEQLLEELTGKSKIEVPDTMWEQIANRRIGELAEEQRKKNSTFEKYAEEQGMSIEQLAESMRQEAKMHVVRAVAIQEIFRKEELRLDNTDLNRELVSMAREFAISPDELFSQLKKNNALDEIQFRAVNRKVADFLREHANLTDVRFDE